MAFKWADDTSDTLLANVREMISGLHSNRIGGYLENAENGISICGHVSVAMLNDIIGSAPDAAKNIYLNQAISIGDDGVVLLLTLKTFGFKIMNPSHAISATIDRHHIC